MPEKTVLMPVIICILHPGKVLLAVEFITPMQDALKKVRQEIDYNFNEFKSIINNKKFKAVYTKGLSKDEDVKLSRPPKGYDENNPAIEFLKLKSIIAMTPLNDALLTDKNFTATVVKAFEALHPLIIFLNKAVEV